AIRMKFAKELDEEAVPEWRDKYLNYKAAKKKLKAVARALRDVNTVPAASTPNSSPFASLRDGPVYSFLQRKGTTPMSGPERCAHSTVAPLMQTRSRSEFGGQDQRIGVDADADQPTPAAPISECSPLKGLQPNNPRMIRYGSIIGTPPDREDSAELKRLQTAPSLELPAPAVEVPPQVSPGAFPVTVAGRQDKNLATSQLAHRGNAYEVTEPVDTLTPLPLPQTTTSLKSQRRQGSLFQLRRVLSTSDTARAVMWKQSKPTSGLRSTANEDIALEAYREADFRRAEFFLFLDREMQKIESFYKEKEDAATKRLKLLREQLHVLRDRRVEELLAVQAKKDSHRPHSRQQNSRLQDEPVALAGQLDYDAECLSDHEQQAGNGHLSRHSHPLKSPVEATRDALGKMRAGRIGRTSKAMSQLGTPPQVLAGRMQSDYVRRDAYKAVPYRAAKRKLKVAMAEYYRGLELLKSYAMVNRTAFRKITKKFDKTTGTNQGKKYMLDKVNGAHFVESDNIDGLLQQVEDLYGRYFERGNRKVAVNKLRQKIAKEGAYYGPTLRTGLLLGIGAVFGIQALVYACIRLLHPRVPGEDVLTAYLLQIYAGYFLMWVLVAMFCVDVAIFSHYRVNYQFIFEFDTRHNLNWKELCELPAWFGMLMGVIGWINFSRWSPEVMYIYWPVVLIGISAILLCLPPPLFYWRARSWFLSSNARLLLAGAFPVEFRDFFLGDMYCSQTYALGNIELFFCLYAQHWRDPPMCNSSHSMLFGFFQTLPGIWRLLQCFRRYYDSGLWTHLANGAKYTCTILQYLSLSTWRIHGGNGFMAFFIASSTVNGLYCSFWDLNYDWSMPLNVYSRPWPLLRGLLAYRKRIWWYYAAMLIDPILRFNWIFYIIYRNDVQHSSLVSFLISLSEAIRRGMWVIFRVENEHCTNVGRFRAQRDPDLPYEIRQEEEQDAVDQAPTEDLFMPHLDDTEESVVSVPRPTPAANASATSGRDVESGRLRISPAAPTSSESPVYAALRRATSTFMSAHAQDYERKRRPAEHDGSEQATKEDGGEDSD
ncbi:hypothetical protein M433DRAFT_29376, partial [Acidomyces richmondensis BFW]